MEQTLSATMDVLILPYSLIIGQKQLKLALELAYIAPRMGGVLLSGQRGTGKSTAVRSFAQMVYGQLPITLPINATEDRVIGGWKIDALMAGKAEPAPGLLEEANGRIFFVDEVNLLDDHIVNIILDVTATGVLVIQREGRRDEKRVSFTLVGTMNPEEGGLRPQLLDRFGLMANIVAEPEETMRGKILETVLKFDEALFRVSRNESVPFITQAREADHQYQAKLEAAKNQLYQVKFPPKLVSRCVKIASGLQTEGHRGDYVMALAARALAALQQEEQVLPEHIQRVAPLALQHRRAQTIHSGEVLWRTEDEEFVQKSLEDE